MKKYPRPLTSSFVERRDLSFGKYSESRRSVRSGPEERKKVPGASSPCRWFPLYHLITYQAHLATAGRRKLGFRRPRNHVSGRLAVDSRSPTSSRGRLRFVSAAQMSLVPNQEHGCVSIRRGTHPYTGDSDRNPAHGEAGRRDSTGEVEGHRYRVTGSSHDVTDAPGLRPSSGSAVGLRCPRFSPVPTSWIGHGDHEFVQFGQLGLEPHRE